MNIALLENFLSPAVEEACLSLQLRDNQNQAVTDDQRVVTCAKSAYSMIAAYLNRSLVRDTYVEYYMEEDTRIRLRNNPITSITSVKFVDDPYSDDLTDSDTEYLLTETTDYKLVRNKDLIVNRNSVDSLSVGNPSRVHVLVEYIGGYKISSSEVTIHNALVMQTIALFNRLPALGVSAMQGNESTSRGASGQMNIATSPDAGNLLEMVLTVLAPFIYYGSAEVA